MSDFLNIQPDFCRSPLPVKDLDWDKFKYNETRVPWFKQILFHDPAKDYIKAAKFLDAHTRINSVPISKVWLVEDGCCGCGCGAKLTKGQRKYSHYTCREFVYGRWFILTGTIATISSLITFYYNDKCAGCLEPIRKVGFELDHIVPVKHGGGGSWLSNYQPLCSDCHKEKTRNDMGWKTKKQPSEIKKSEIIHGNQLELF